MKKIYDWRSYGLSVNMEVKNKIMNCLNFTNNLAGVLMILKRKKKA